LITPLSVVGDGCLDQGSCIRVLVVEGGGHSRSLGDGSDVEPSAFAPKLRYGLLELGQFVTGLAEASGDRGRWGVGSGCHAASPSSISGGSMRSAVRKAVD